MRHTSALITGGAGFIGRATALRCLAQDWRVTVYDNFCAGKRENLAEFRRRIELIEGDVTDAAALSGAIQRAEPDIVFHLAAHHFIPFCNAHPQETIRVNGEGTFAVLSAACEHGVRDAVVASSGVLYPGREGALSETESPVIGDVYSLSKQITEEVCRYFATTCGMNCVAARLFNTYGPYETNPHVIPHIMESLHSGPCVRLGNTAPRRDYIYVEDVANLLVHLAEAASGYLAVNVGTGVEYSVTDIVAELSRLLSHDIEVITDPSRVRTVDKMHQIADTTLLQQVTGQRAQHSLTDGLAKLLRAEGLLA